MASMGQKEPAGTARPSTASASVPAATPRTGVGLSQLAQCLPAQVAHQRHFVELGLGTAGLSLGNLLELQLHRQLQALHVLEGTRQFHLHGSPLALQFTQGSLEILPPTVDRAQK